MLDPVVRQSVRVSVVMATRHGSREIRRALRSVLAGTVRPDELIVLDQSDDDRTRLAVEEIRALPGGQILRYIASTRLGLCAHRNDALAAATGDFIASIDDDVAVAPDWLERMLHEWVDAWQRRDVLVTGRILRPPEVGPDDLITAIRDLPQRKVWQGRPLIADVLIGAQFGAPRTLFERLAPMPFDERLGVGARFSGADDDEFAYRVMALGCPVVYEPSIWCTHHTVRVSGWRRMIRTRAYGAGASMAKHFLGGERRMLLVFLEYIMVQCAKSAKAAIRLQEPECSSRLLAIVGVVAGCGRWCFDAAVGRLEPASFRQPGATPALGIDFTAEADGTPSGAPVQLPNE